MFVVMLKIVFIDGCKDAMQSNQISFSNSFSRELRRLGFEKRILFSFFRLDYLQELLFMF